jgi:hypothetical protein
MSASLTAFTVGTSQCAADESAAARAVRLGLTRFNLSLERLGAGRGVYVLKFSSCCPLMLSRRNVGVHAWGRS